MLLIPRKCHRSQKIANIYHLFLILEIYFPTWPERCSNFVQRKYKQCHGVGPKVKSRTKIFCYHYIGQSLPKMNVKWNKWMLNGSIQYLYQPGAFNVKNSILLSSFGHNLGSLDEHCTSIIQYSDMKWKWTFFSQ